MVDKTCEILLVLNLVQAVKGLVRTTFVNNISGIKNPPLRSWSFLDACPYLYITLLYLIFSLLQTDGVD